MKIKSTKKPYDEVMGLPQEAHVTPAPQKGWVRHLMKALSAKELSDVHFRMEEKGTEAWKEGEPALVLMNHSSFIDLKIASTYLVNRPFHIVMTRDGFVGRAGLMRMLGCIPTRKFISDAVLARDMMYITKTLGESVLMYPEASYSFDGTATPLPDSLGSAARHLGVPVIMIRTYGAFQRDPLYNNLQIRQVDVSAEVKYLLSPEELASMSVEEINARIREEFSFDNWRWQKEAGVLIKEPFRADHLNRVLYKCPHCKQEGRMLGKGTSLTCSACGASWELAEDGTLIEEEGESPFTFVSDWYAWEREEVRKEILDGTYHLELPVKIRMLVDEKSIYEVGEGTLVHTIEGFHLMGVSGKLDFYLSPKESYSLYSDYYWYEIGDMICIGDYQRQYYCFPGEGVDVAAKTRLATEELYRLSMRKKTTQQQEKEESMS